MAESFGILSTYPPTECGLATFSYELGTSMRALGAQVEVVRMVDTTELPVEHVSHQYVRDMPQGAAKAAEALNACGTVIIQHEYGIFPGPDGQDILDVTAHLNRPPVVVFHTVLADPEPNQRRIVQQLLDTCGKAVVMTETARVRLLDMWQVDAGKVVVIPHGAADTRPTREYRTPVVPTVLTWGLLGPGKGLEWAIAAMSIIEDKQPDVIYNIVGKTHPRVLEREGQKYRRMLEGLVADLGLTERVRFDDRYLSSTHLRDIVEQAEVVLLPYDSAEQVTSGVLVEAIVSGKPVISTSFPHAREMLAQGTGILVPQKDSHAIARALLQVFENPGQADSMRAASKELALDLLWPTVAGQYIKLGSELKAPTLLGVST